jgi:hypothetical protein
LVTFVAVWFLLLKRDKTRSEMPLNSEGSHVASYGAPLPG